MEILSQLKEPYTFERLVADIHKLAERFPHLGVHEIGRSVWGRTIYALSLGTGPVLIHYNASHHGREWMTTPILMHFVSRVCSAHVSGVPLAGVDVAELFARTTLWLVPMVNPDGVAIAQGQLPTGVHREQLIALNDGSEDTRRWKANARGVDLNLQYRAAWPLARRRGRRRPGPVFYAGKAPESEPESRALAEHVRRHPFAAAIALHAQGEIIFWDFEGKAPPHAERLAQRLATATGYALAANSVCLNRFGGFKDWFILSKRAPAYTLEVGRGTTPLPLADYPSILQTTLPALVRFPLWVAAEVEAGTRSQPKPGAASRGSVASRGRPIRTTQRRLQSSRKAAGGPALKKGIRPKTKRTRRL